MSFRASASSAHFSTRNFSFARQPSTNFAFSAFMTSIIFLPIALRSLSESPREKLARSRERSMTCSW